MANVLLTPSVIAEEALMQLDNNCVMGNQVFRGYEQEWMKKVNGWKKGNSITAKAPLQARVKDGETIDVVDYREEDITLIVDKRKHVAHKLTGTEMTLDIEAFSDRYLKPDMEAIANYIDETLLGLYKYIPNQVGTPGSTPSQLYTLAEAGAVLTDQSVPKDGRSCVLDPWATAKIADSVKGLLHQKMVGDVVQKGKLGDLSGFGVFETQNINSHTCGTGAGASTLLMDGATAEGAVALVIDENESWSKTFKQGDILSVAAVNGVNSISGQSMGRLRQFVVEADVTTAGNEATVSTTPGVAPWNIYSSAAAKTYLPYQTIDTLPATNAVVSCMGSSGLVHKVNMAFHKNCLALFMVPVEPLQGMKTYRKSHKGFTLTVTIGSDIINYVTYMRIDVLFGVKAINPFMGCRIAG